MPDYEAIARQAAVDAGIDPDTFVRQIMAESSFNPDAQSPAGAQGIAQIMPATAAGWGVDPNDPVASLQAAASHMAGYLNTYGSWPMALAAYNWGPGNLQRFGLSQAPAETRNYITNIVGSGGGKPPGGFMAEGSGGGDPSQYGGGGGTTDTGGTKVEDLGNGYSLVSWTDPDTGLTKSQIVPNKDAASIAAVEAAKVNAGAAGTSARITTEGANQRAAAQAEIDRAKNAADAAHQAALDALAQGNAAEARRQFDISSAELQRYHTLDVGIRQQEANTSAQTAGYNIYKDLTDKASNPRNFMEQFFTHRGQTAPPGSAAYGNTATGPQGIMPFEKWLPNFMQQTLGSYGTPSGAGAANSPAASASPFGPSAPSYMQNLGGQNNPNNPYAGTNQNYGGSPTIADTAVINGVKTWAGGAYSGQPVASSPSDAGDLTPYLKQGQAVGQARMMAQGGQVTMTAPHALVNLLTGRVAAIAGEAGKEHARFDGAAIINPLGKPNLNNPDMPPDTATGGTTPTTTTEPAAPASPQPSSGIGDPFGPIPETPGAPVPQPIGSAPPPATTPTPETPPPGYRLGGPGEPHFVPLATTQPVPQLTSKPLPLSTPIPGPVFGPPITTLPPPINAWGGPSYTNPATLQSTPSGLGLNPQFLPEEAANVDPIVKQMIQNQSFPPFLQRLYAQAKGLPGLGTNVPQQTNLPPGVPLVSKLAYNQMSPSEQQAFASFLSAHGITLEDYLSMVEAASPQGGTTPTNPAVPKFLSQGG